MRVYLNQKNNTMTILLTFLSFFLVTTTSVDAIADYAGTYAYALQTPEGPVAGSLILTPDGDAYTGVLSAYGEEYELENMTWDGPKLSFTANAGGYNIEVSGTFKDETYTAVIQVEGIEIPMKATKE